MLLPCRLLLCGEGDCGQKQVAETLRLALEGCPMLTVSLPLLVMEGQGDPVQGMIALLKEFVSRLAS